MTRQEKLIPQSIAREQIFKAADQLTQADRNPTVMAIRAHLGSGSPNTIGPHLADWKAQHDEAVQAEAVPPFPEPVEAAMRKVWSLALSQAQDQLEGEREALNLARKEIEQERAELSAEIERLDTALEHAKDEGQKAVEALDTERTAHRQSTEKLQGELTDLRTEATTAREKAANLEGQVAALKERFEALTVAKPDPKPEAKAPARRRTTKATGPAKTPDDQGDKETSK